MNRYKLISMSGTCIWDSFLGLLSYRSPHLDEDAKEAVNWTIKALHDGVLNPETLAWYKPAEDEAVDWQALEAERLQKEQSQPLQFPTALPAQKTLQEMAWEMFMTNPQQLLIQDCYQAAHDFLNYQHKPEVPKSKPKPIVHEDLTVVRGGFCGAGDIIPNEPEVKLLDWIEEDDGTLRASSCLWRANNPSAFIIASWRNHYLAKFHGIGYTIITEGTLKECKQACEQYNRELAENNKRAT